MKQPPLERAAGWRVWGACVQGYPSIRARRRGGQSIQGILLIADHGLKGERNGKQVKERWVTGADYWLS